MKADIVQVKGLTFVGKAASGHWVTMDGPADFHGHDSATRPKELILIGLGGCTGADVASILNKRGMKTGDGLSFTSLAVSRIRSIYGLKKRYNRLREKGLLTRNEIIKELGTTDGKLKKWKDNGLIKVHAYGDCGTKILYELPGFLASLALGAHTVSPDRYHIRISTFSRQRGHVPFKIVDVPILLNHPGAMNPHRQLAGHEVPTHLRCLHRGW